jgi:hypothetical protein
MGTVPAKVVGCANEAFPEKLLAEAVYQHAGGKGGSAAFRISEPLCERGTPAGRAAVFLGQSAVFAIHQNT